MTFAELQTLLARYLGLGALADDPDVAAWAPDALNDAQLEIATLFKIPRYEEIVTFNANPLAVTTSTPQYGGLLSAVDLDAGRPLSVVDRTRLYHEVPNFNVATATAAAQYIVQSEQNPAEFSLYPVPVTTPRQVALFYAANPAQMVNPTDVPWDGQYEVFHDIVALRATLLLTEADWADPERIKWVEQRYNNQMSRFAQAVAPGAQLHAHNVTEN